MNHIEAISQSIQTLPYLHSFFFIGSTKKANVNAHSDLDVVLICREESLLDRLLIVFHDLLEQEYGLIYFTKPSSYHIYAQLHNGVILDANIFPPLVLSFVNPEIQRATPDPKALFYGAFILMRRLKSKLIKKEFVLIPRFLEQMRSLYLFPLLGQITHPFEIGKLDAHQQQYLLKTYVPPMEQQCHEALAACLGLLQEILVTLPIAPWKEDVSRQLGDLMNEPFAKSRTFTESLLSANGVS